MGTVFRIVLYATDSASASQVSELAFQRIAALDRSMTDYQSGSELMLLCRKAGGPPVEVSADLFRVLARAQEISRRSEGAFDVTVGPVVRLWRQARTRHRLPAPQGLASALKLVGYEKVRLNSTARTVQLLQAGMLLDLGAIAKGYAADEALKLLKEHGIACALVAGGGDIALGDPPPGKGGWVVGIASLEGLDRSHLHRILIHNAGISTSGDLEQHMVIAGTRYSHVVDPMTGQALTGRRSVTVIAPDDATADSLATAVSVLGPGRGLKLINSMPGTSALFIEQVDQGLRTFEAKFPK
jgi:thiamine biosynthesis lipoprotein